MAHVPVGQLFTDNTTKGLGRASFIGDAKGHSFVIPKIEFSKITLQMLLANMMPEPESLAAPKKDHARATGLAWPRRRPQGPRRFVLTALSRSNALLARPSPLPPTWAAIIHRKFKTLLLAQPCVFVSGANFTYQGCFGYGEEAWSEVGRQSWCETDCEDARTLYGGHTTAR